MRTITERLVKEVEKRLEKLANTDNEEELKGRVKSCKDEDDSEKENEGKKEVNRTESGEEDDGKRRETKLHILVFLGLDYSKGSVLNRLVEDRETVEDVLREMYFAKIGVDENDGTLIAEKANPICHIDLAFKPGRIAARGARIHSELPLKILVQALDRELAYLIEALEKRYVTNHKKNKRKKNQKDKCERLYT